MNIKPGQTMKSIIEEGSSIAKAVEQAWLQAEKPTEFSIKIFQQPIKNFFGFTTVSAKIGIFFADTQKPEKIIRAKEKNIIKAPTSPKNDIEQDIKETEQLWNQELCSFAQEWLHEALLKMNKADVVISLKPQKHILKIQFSSSLMLDSTEIERRFFGNLSHLMLAALRTKTQLPLRNLQISMRQLR